MRLKFLILAIVILGLNQWAKSDSSCLDNIASSGLVPEGVVIDSVNSRITSHAGNKVQVITKDARFTLSKHSCDQVDASVNFQKKINSWIQKKAEQLENDLKANKEDSESTQIGTREASLTSQQREVQKSELRSLREARQDLLKDSWKWRKWLKECTKASEPTTDVRSFAQSMFNQLDVYSAGSAAPGAGKQ